MIKISQTVFFTFIHKVCFFFRKLRYINVTGLSDIPDLKLICLLLEESLPGVYIEGSPEPSPIENPLEQLKLTDKN